MGRRVGTSPFSAAIVALIALSGQAGRAADTPPRVTLLPAGTRASVLVELDADAAGATAIEATDNRTVAVEIGPVRQSIASQLLQAADRSPIVDRVRLRATPRGVDGTVVTIHVMTKQPVVGFVRRSARRIYIDLVPRERSRAPGVQSASQVADRRTLDAGAPASTIASAPQTGVPSAAPAASASPSVGSRGGNSSGDVEARAAQLAKTADVRGLEGLKRDLEARRDAPTAASGDAASLDAALLRLDVLIQEAQRNRLAADAALLRAGQEPAGSPSAPRASAASPSSSSSSDEQAISELRAFRTDLERIAQAANVWTGGKPPSALVTLSAMLPRFRTQHAPANIAKAHATLCAALDQLALIWASASASPPPEGSDPPAMERVRVALEQYLTLERALNGASPGL